MTMIKANTVGATLTFMAAVVLVASCVHTSSTTSEVPLKGFDSLSVTTPKKEPSPVSTIAIYDENGTLKRKLTYQLDPDDTLPTPKYLNHIKAYPLSDTINGDFNGDGNKDTAWIVRDADSYFRCQDTQNEKVCRGIIRFSDKAIPKMVIEFCPWGFPKNEGDLNENGGDEIGILPGWFNSSCRVYQVFTLKKNKWREACDPISNSLNMREAGVVLIEKDPDKKGHAIIRSSFENSQWCSCQNCSVVERSIKMR